MSRKRFEIISTAFDKRNRPITTQKNSYKRTHTLQKYFSEKVGMHPDRAYLHAELHACIKSNGRPIETMLVQRFDAEGNPADAKPCPSCVEALKAFGVQKVRWTSRDGIKEQLVKDM